MTYVCPHIYINKQTFPIFNCVTPESVSLANYFLSLSLVIAMKQYRRFLTPIFSIYFCIGVKTSVLFHCYSDKDKNIVMDIFMCVSLYWPSSLSLNWEYVTVCNEIKLTSYFDIYILVKEHISQFDISMSYAQKVAIRNGWQIWLKTYWPSASSMLECLDIM